MAFIIALILALGSIIGAVLIVPRLASSSVNARVCALWVIAAILFFLIQQPAAVYVALAFAFLALSPAGPVGKVAVYIATAAFLPFTFGWMVPFPGVNFLLILSPAKLAALMLLLPALAVVLKGPHDATRSVLFLTAFCIYGGLLLSGEFSATATTRFAVDQLLVYALPFAAIVYAVRTKADVDQCVDAIIMASVIMVGIAALSTVWRWNFYGFNIFVDERGGFVRVTGTGSNHSLGMHLVAGLMLLEAAKQRLGIAGLRLWLLRLGFLAALYVTGSRGAQAGFVLSAMLYFALTTERPFFRRFIFAGLLAGFTAACVWLVVGDVGRVDGTGTFSYRQDLLRTAVRYLMERPFFGDYDFARSGRFEHLIQGQQIIDITNYYLQIALTFGLIGFVLVFQPFAVATWRLGRAAVAPVADPELKRTQIALLSSLAGWFLTAATTSDFGITVHVGLVLCALGHATLGIARSSSRVAEVGHEGLLAHGARP